MKYIDLHVHSLFSDGTCTPEELVDKASAQGLVAFALTDHDTVGGVERALEAAKDICRLSRASNYLVSIRLHRHVPKKFIFLATILTGNKKNFLIH